jgi:hypothetical protein
VSRRGSAEQGRCRLHAEWGRAVALGRTGAAGKNWMHGGGVGGILFRARREPHMAEAVQIYGKST